MKTSNRILLITLAMTLLILVAIHIALLAQLNSGNYTVIKDPFRSEFEEHVLNNVNYVLMDGLDEVQIVPSDTLSVGLRKQDADRVIYKVEGNTLRLRLDTTNEASIRRDYLPVVLRIPSGIPVEASNSGVLLEGATDSATASVNTFILKASSLTAGQREETRNQYWKQLSITASGESQINLAGICIIDSSNIQLSNSLFDDRKATFQKIAITADDSSKINMTSRNLKKASISIKP